MDCEQIRRDSLEKARRLGYEVAGHLPLLDHRLALVSMDCAIARLLCLHSVAACAFGLDRQKAIAWLLRERLHSSLTLGERQFIEENEGAASSFQMEIEAMWALAWALSAIQELDFGKNCSSTFVTILPDLRRVESSVRFRQRASLRPLPEIAAAADLAYCLHWAVRQIELDGRRWTGNVEPYVIVERRHALDWLLGDHAWDQTPTDT